MAFGIAVLAAAQASAAAPAAAAEAPVVAEARAFMADYQRDLASGNRAGIAARYDRRGAYMLGRGTKKLLSHDFLREGYMTKWRQPKAFAFEDLSFEPAGPDAVVVVGKFKWTNAEVGSVGLDGTSHPSAAAKTFTYTGLLVRQDGVLRIRVEDEDPAPEPKAAVAK